MRPIVITLSFFLVVLQYRLWIGEGSFAQHQSVREQIAERVQDNRTLQARNDALAAKVIALQQGRSEGLYGLPAVEEYARQELGMIRKDETFFYMPD
ncbi:septum formation initiator family protein [Sansalvadorimonas sp. 2012CJ34-2]|uniref:Cell division protein FtsB n=1 Tax=Parendozoicomonas callyspongiae TaxID=2942213 RepID=A0ABT0PD89_9GAMM|nr:septum formation initiator family protein [Sansalvadorimonas sp. 2012CJ34-2]MCL6269305.1 septum formation initiator family protein [Sansalvadorimonas sp. 2012CJ34-2]